MEYLKRVLGIEVLYEKKALEHLPEQYLPQLQVMPRLFLHCTYVSEQALFPRPPVPDRSFSRQ